MVAGAYRLEGFDPGLAARIAGWAQGSEELAWWASLRPADAVPQIFAGWHADSDVHPWVLWDAGRPVGYGEVWEDAGEHEAELARIIVDPDSRGRGAGRALAGLLVECALELGYADIWVRIVPANLAAIACYRAAGFRPAAAELERSFNAGQPREYRWMRHQPGN